jgi:hypothetical protein
VTAGRDGLCPKWCAADHADDNVRDRHHSTCESWNTGRGSVPPGQTVVLLSRLDDQMASGEVVIGAPRISVYSYDFTASEDDRAAVLRDLTGEQAAVLAVVLERTGADKRMVAALRTAAAHLSENGGGR